MLLVKKRTDLENSPQEAPQNASEAPMRSDSLDALRDNKVGDSPEVPVSPRISPPKKETGPDIESGKDATPTSWLNEVFTEAARLNVSDVHIVPEKDYLSLYFRMNGTFREVAQWNIDYHEMVVSRIKVLAGLQVVEKNIPQDGRLELLFETPKTDSKAFNHPQSVNFRVSTMPTINGEAVVLRALNKEGQLLSIDQIGLSAKALPVLKKMLQRGHGVIMMTGHSGSGKTTTLYSALNELNSSEKAIITLEDPVEYRLPGVRQSQVNPFVGYGFENGLKAVLRQDPDVVMVGEIRDEETANIALRLALVGRLVLTTLHTSNISGAITRLLEMDIGKSVTASAFTGVLSERLVRQICPSCKAPAELPRELMTMFDVEWPEDVQTYVGTGCDACSGTGFLGRVGIFEILEIDDNFRSLIIQGAPLTELDAYVKSHVVEALRDDGFEKVRQGITTLEEVIRATI